MLLMDHFVREQGNIIIIIMANYVFICTKM